MGLWSNRNSALTETSETLHTPPPTMDKGGGQVSILRSGHEWHTKTRASQ